MATSHAGSLPSRSGHAAALWRRVLFGPPLTESAVSRERMPSPSRWRSSPRRAVVGRLRSGGDAGRPGARRQRGVGLSLPIALAIAVLMVSVGVSYRQLIRAYPTAAAATSPFTRTSGSCPHCIAAAGLLIDYTLTVAVSISAGIAAITAALPDLRGDEVPLGLAVIALLLAGNLRGVRQAGTIFAAPTYAFVLAMLALIAVGLTDASARGFAAPQDAGLAPLEAVTVPAGTAGVRVGRDGHDRDRGDL